MLDPYEGDAKEQLVESDSSRSTGSEDVDLRVATAPKRSYNLIRKPLKSKLSPSGKKRQSSFKAEGGA